MHDEGSSSSKQLSQMEEEGQRFARMKEGEERLSVLLEILERWKRKEEPLDGERIYIDLLCESCKVGGRANFDIPASSRVR